MTIKNWLTNATKKLEQVGIGTARLDALVLFEDVLKHERAWLLANQETEIDTAQMAKLQKLLKRRAKHEPLAYVRGKTEFYGREFKITSAVLEPRPESETMIDCLKALYEKAASDTSKPINWQIADVGTGCGAIGITAALELPKCGIKLLEIDPKALKVAQNNVDKFTLDISAIKSDLLQQSSGDYDVLLCNLPYVPDDYQINAAAGSEPKLAIFGRPDGLDIYRRLFEQVKVIPKRPLYILTEALPFQHDQLAEIAASAGYELQQVDDFIQVFALAT